MSILFARSLMHDRKALKALPCAFLVAAGITWTTPQAAAQTTEAPAASQTNPPANAQPTQPTPQASQPGTAVPSTPAQPAAEPSQAAAPSSAASGGGSLLDSTSQAISQLLPAGERSDIPHNLSPLGMFMAADWVVKSVMIGLGLASLLTWTVWLAKSLELMGARRRALAIVDAVRQSRTLSDALVLSERRKGPAALMLHEAARELKLSEGALEHADNGGVKERVASILSRIEVGAGRRMMRGTGALATIGSVGPFVGLFGTVWGIMNSFIGISESQTTNLAVVAPGIAEALLATAIGLVAAIPAVVIYNIFARSITGYRQLLADAAAGVERLVSRDLDFRKVPPGARAKPSMSLMAGE